MTDVVPLHSKPDERQIAHYLGLNWQDPKTHAVLAVCQRYQLDPVLKHVIVIPKGGVYITRDGLLHIAHRSGMLDGIRITDGPVLEAGYWTARVAVYRKDWTHPTEYPGRYPANGGNKAYAPEMAIKCAEAMALRRAFDVTGLPALDEMHDQAPTPQSPPPVWVDDDAAIEVDSVDVDGTDAPV